jgi:hypothetical protein
MVSKLYGEGLLDKNVDFTIVILLFFGCVYKLSKKEV